MHIDFMAPFTQFLGLKFLCDSNHINNTKHLRVHLSQPAFTENILSLAGLSHDTAPSHQSTPFRSGLPIDFIPQIPLSPSAKSILQFSLRQLVSSFLWLSQATFLQSPRC